MTGYFLKMLLEEEKLKGNLPKNIIGDLHGDTEFVEYSFFLFSIF